MHIYTFSGFRRGAAAIISVDRFHWERLHTKLRTWERKVVELMHVIGIATKAGALSRKGPVQLRHADSVEHIVCKFLFV